MGVYGLLGEHLAHSFSPEVHAMFGDYEYHLFEKSRSEFADFLLSDDFDGLNITVPYKKLAVPYCAGLSPVAKKIGSVNTVVRRHDGTLFGDNTDYCGFTYLLDKTNIAGKKALLLGSGGAGAMVRIALKDRGASEIITVSREGKTNYKNASEHSDAHIIVNATPVGMYPNNGARLIDLSDFPKCSAVIDVVYNPAKTELILDAEDLGITAIGGLAMLTVQAKCAAEIFMGKKIPDDAIEDVTEKISRRMRNIVLIGMPGSGKSMTGKYLAALTGREFLDTDDMVIERAGKSIERIFAEDGEEAFRTFERAALYDATKCSRCVIATGGGIVKDPKNRRLIRQNSVAVVLDRKLSELETGGRPLSLSRGVEALYKERMPKYREWGDFTVQATGVNETAKKIMELTL